MGGVNCALGLSNGGLETERRLDEGDVIVNSLGNADDANGPPPPSRLSGDLSRTLQRILLLKKGTKTCKYFLLIRELASFC